ncbi:DUF4397 domain-containing protein [Lapillicoccus sp.]|uniref:DUF4397 domain-containing protein n=1 Tax=Lapillicoccus sp. TaxID=1909287 RepID=UPI0025F10AB8|nr:DUF4397 domain-containing protein [Lapillicoccus sp.]
MTTLRPEHHSSSLEITMTTTTSVSHRRLLWSVLTGLLLIAVTALSAGPANADSVGAAGATPPGKAWIRAGHFIPGFGAARVDLKPASGSTGSIVMSPNAGYGDVTSYQKLDPGTYTVSIWDATAPADATPTLSRSFTAASGKAQTIAVIGTASAPRLAILSDDLTPPAAGSARVRVLSASSLAPMVNVMAVNGPTIATDAVLGTTTGYTTVPDGAWTLNLSGSSMSSKQTVTLASGSVYTAVALDSGLTAVTIKVITDAAGAVATPVGAAATGFGGAASQQAVTASQATSHDTSEGIVWAAVTALLGSLLLGSALLRAAVRRTARQPVRVTSGR